MVVGISFLLPKHRVPAPVITLPGPSQSWTRRFRDFEEKSHNMVNPWSILKTSRKPPSFSNPLPEFQSSSHEGILLHAPHSTRNTPKRSTHPTWLPVSFRRVPRLGVQSWSRASRRASPARSVREACRPGGCHPSLRGCPGLEP